MLRVFKISYMCWHVHDINTIILNSNLIKFLLFSNHDIVLYQNCPSYFKCCVQKMRIWMKMNNNTILCKIDGWFFIFLFL